MVSLATSKSGVIDRMRVTAVTAITPCVGGLVIWYPDHDDVGHPAPEQQASAFLSNPTAATSSHRPPSDPRTAPLSLRKPQK